MITITNEQIEILEDAIDVFGKKAQIWMAIEEMSELSCAIARERRGRASIADIAEEVADVFIMMQQLAIMTDPKLVQEIVNKKMERLARRIEEDNINAT